MHTFSVQQIMSVKDKFVDPPYPGFSLEEVCRRKAVAAPTVLQRSEHAWKITAAMTEEDGVSRVMQGALNKLAPEKYDTVLEQLKQPLLYKTERAMGVVINLIFNKALDEPGYSELYARLCFDLAKYELSIQSTPTPSSDGSPATMMSALLSNLPTPDKKKSKLRDAIIHRTQKEFLESSSNQNPKVGSTEEQDYVNMKITKRKKANIKFVGQLFLKRVIGAQIMLTIIQLLLEKTPYPDVLDIELLTELLETIGRQLDGAAEFRSKLDGHFEYLESLTRDHHYTSRIHFKILDLLDLRDNNWEPRVRKANTQTPTTLGEHLQEQQQQQRTQTSLRLNPRSPTMATPTTRRGANSSGKFPSIPFPESPSPNTPAPAFKVTAPQRETPHSQEKMSAPVPNEPPQFSHRIKQMMTEWVADQTDEPVLGWSNKLRSPQFRTDSERNHAIVCELIFENCTVTRKEAQREACSFILLGLCLDEDDVIGGLTLALARSIEENILEDVPKWNERFVVVLMTVFNSKENIVEFYRHCARIIYGAFDIVKSMEGIDAIDSELKLWKLLPRPVKDDMLPVDVIRIVAGLRTDDLLCADLLVSLCFSGLLQANGLVEWSQSPSGSAAPNLVEAIAKKLSDAPKPALSGDAEHS